MRSRAHSQWPIYFICLITFFSFGCGPFPHPQWLIPVRVQSPHHCTQVTALLFNPKEFTKQNLCHMPPPGRAVILLYYPSGYRSCSRWQTLTGNVIVPTYMSSRNSCNFQSFVYDVYALGQRGQKNIPVLAIHYADIFCPPIHSMPLLHRPWRHWPFDQPLIKTGYRFNLVRLEIATQSLQSIKLRNLRLKICDSHDRHCSVTRLFPAH